MIEQDAQGRPVVTGADAIVVEGPLCGGHAAFHFEDLRTGNTPTLEELLPDVLLVAEEFGQQYSRKIPVVVAGGVFSGKDIAKFLRLGAGGVQMATRFVATHECDVVLAYKEAFLRAEDDDVILIPSPVGLPIRVR